MSRYAWLATVIFGFVGLALAQQSSTADRSPAQRIADPRLENAFWLHPKVISGGQPDEDGFQALRDLGVKTIISVDGARPEVETAKKLGMRYVHLPHGYDGIPERRVLELAKAVRDLPGPVYIHCHHGKHRSPAAAAAVCVGLGFLDAQESLAVLETAGTSPHYRGLYRTVREFGPLAAETLDKLDVEFQETADIPPIAESMVAMEHTHDHLKTIAAAGWRVPADLPDLEPVHEALLMREHYTELLRTEAVQAEPEGFRQLLKTGEAESTKLQSALERWKKAGASGQAPRAIQNAFEAITRNCTACHQQFRDKPIQEKN